MPENEPGKSEEQNELPEIDLSQKGDSHFEELSEEEIKHEKVFHKKHEKRALQLLGLDREYDVIKDTEKEALLKSEERIRAFEKIETTTNPPKARIKQKQGIVSETIKKSLISEEVLKNEPMLYFGSGTDVEYPLALGGRNIVMVDAMFKEDKGGQEVRDYILQRLRKLTHKEIAVEDDSFVFDFDFGEGVEKVKVELVGVELPSPYTPEEEREKLSEGYGKLPEKVGIVLRFASGGMTLDEIKPRVVEGGVTLSEDYLSRKNKADEWEGSRLGKEKE